MFHNAVLHMPYCTCAHYPCRLGVNVLMFSVLTYWGRLRRLACAEVTELADESLDGQISEINDEIFPGPW